MREPLAPHTSNHTPCEPRARAAPRTCRITRRAAWPAGTVLPVHSDPIGDQPAVRVTDGVRAAEAVALLRRFYAQENQHAPEPQKRTRKQLELAARAVEPSAGEAT